MFYHHKGIKLDIKNSKSLENTQVFRSQKKKKTQNNPWVKEGVTKKIRKYFEFIINENTTNQNFCDAKRCLESNI